MVAKDKYLPCKQQMKKNDTNYWFFEAFRWNALESHSMIPLIYFKDVHELSEKSVAKAKTDC